MRDHEQQVKHPDDAPFARRRIREKGWDEVEDRRDPEVQREQRIAGGRADGVAVGHDAMFPAAIGVFAFEKHLNVPADAFDACVQREARFEADRQHQQGNQGRNRPGASAAVAIVRAAHATKVASCSHIRVVPRSRMVSRSALYSANSRAVMPSFLDPARRRKPGHRQNTARRG